MQYKLDVTRQSFWGGKCLRPARGAFSYLDLKRPSFKGKDGSISQTITDQNVKSHPDSTAQAATLASTIKKTHNVTDLFRHIFLGKVWAALAAPI